MIDNIISEETLTYLSELWQAGLIMSIALVVAIVTIYCMVRYVKLFTDYIEDGSVDRFDDSCMMEAHFTMGTHPMGITIDFVFYSVIGALCSLAWPLFWVVVLLTVTALYIRAKRRRAEQLVAVLKGEEGNQEWR